VRFAIIGSAVREAGSFDPRAGEALAGDAAPNRHAAVTTRPSPGRTMPFMDALDPIVRESLVVAAVLCFPILAAATAVGTLVAIVQAATQVQEQTLTLLPKMLVVGAMTALFGGFALRLCGALFSDALAALPAIVRGA
jgi:flagellar biosynthetic protein FliQ